jgi:hypothetical protein
METGVKQVRNGGLPTKLRGTGRPINLDRAMKWLLPACVIGVLLHAGIPGGTWEQDQRQ